MIGYRQVLSWGSALLGCALSMSVSAATAGVDPVVTQAMASAADGRASVVIRMRDQADLSAASRIEDWSARGWAVYSALRGMADDTQPAVMARIEVARARGQASNVKSFWIVNAIALNTDHETLQALTQMPEVGSVLPAFKPEVPAVVVEAPTAAPNAPEWGIAKIRAPEVWSTYATTGAGAVLANVDTGVQFNHPALVNQYRGNLGGGNFDHNYNWFDPTGATTAPADGNGHGTHVMGTEVGRDGANEIGVAPGAKWIAAFGCCPSNDALLEAQQFMVAPTDLAGNGPNPDLRPHVLNQSWGGPGGSEIFEDVIAALRAAGIFPAFSAGNNGGTGATGCGRLGSPGDNPSAFNVGNTNSSDQISGTSSRGPNPITGRIGPHVSAPGTTIRSSVPGSTYSNFSGTSMASPHVAGAVGLLIAVEPELAGRIDELEELLRKTAVPLTSTQACGGVPGSQVPNNVFGWGRIDVKAAADMIAQGGYIEGVVTVGGVATAGVTVTYNRLGKTLTTTTNASGRYRVLAGAGSWAMSAMHRGQVANAPAVVVAQDAATVQDFAIATETRYTVTGTVTQSGSGEGIQAMLMVVDQDAQAPVWSAPVSGAYTLELPAGTWNVIAMHPGYQSVTQSVSAAGTTNFKLTPIQNYSCLDNTDVGGPTYAWTDISDGTAFNLDDDASSAQQTLPGTFTYFGNPFTTARINSNGFLYFGTTTFNTANMYLPFEGQPNNDVMALGEDLNPSLGTQGTIFSKTVGSRYIVQYHQVQHWASGFPETFQIILDTATGGILYQYHTLSNPHYTSTGVENATGTVGQIYSFRNSANLVPGRAVQFLPATGNAVNWGCDHALTLTLSDDIDPAPTGAQITYQLRWNLTGFGGAPGTTLTATIPTGSSFVAASGGITPVGNQLTWNLGNQRPNGRGTAWFTVTANSGPTLQASAAITDSSGQSRSAAQSTAINGAVVLDDVFANGFE